MANLPPYKSTALPWNNANLPWKDYGTTAAGYTDGQPWNDPRLPWQDPGIQNTYGAGGGGTAGVPIGLLLTLTKAS